MRTLLRVALYVFLLNLWLPSAVANSNDCRSKGKATIMFDVTNGVDLKVGSSKLTVESFLNVATNQELRRKFRYIKGTWTADKIPYGRYTLKVSGDGFVPTGRLIDVCDLFAYVEVPTRFGMVRIETMLDLRSGGPKAPGKPLHELVMVTSFRREDGTDFSKQFKLGEADKIPYGIYELEAIGPLGGTIRREVDVFQPEVWVLAGFPVTFGDVFVSGPSLTLSGTVKNIPEAEKPVFVKLVGTDCDSMFDDKVSASSGSFSMAIWADNCSFLLFTIGKSGILDVRELSLPAHGGIEVDLDSAHRLLKP